MDKSVWRKLIPILISNAVCWFYALSFVPLAYMYNEFPGQDTLVMSVATLPSLICMFAGLAAAPMMRKMDKKTVVIIGLILSAGGGLLVRFLGAGNLWVALIGSAITGIPAGLISAANYAALAEIAPEDMRDKVCGWGDFRVLLWHDALVRSRRLPLRRRQLGPCLRLLLHLPGSPGARHRHVPEPTSH